MLSNQYQNYTFEKEYMQLLNSLTRILFSQLFRIPFVFRMALFLYEHRKKTNIGLAEYSYWFKDFPKNPFDIFQEIREFTGIICDIRNGLQLINRLYAQQDTIPPFLVCFKLYEEGKALKNYFISFY